MGEEQGQSYNVLGRYAGFVTRLIAFVVDRAITGIVSLLVLLSIQWVLNAFAINKLLFGWDEIPWQVASAVSAAVFILISFGYDLVFWMLVGQTPGKVLMGVRVVRTDGQRLRFGNALRRRLAYILSGILFLGYLWILFDNRRQGLHDKLAGTLVVYSWPEQEMQGTMVRDRVQEFLEERQASRGQVENARP